MTSDRLAVLPQYLLPKQALTIFAGWVANAKAGSLTTKLIRWFVKKYQVDMTEAANPDISSYASFNEFFTASQVTNYTWNPQRTFDMMVLLRNLHSGH